MEFTEVCEHWLVHSLDSDWVVAAPLLGLTGLLAQLWDTEALTQ